MVLLSHILKILRGESSSGSIQLSLVSPWSQNSLPVPVLESEGSKVYVALVSQVTAYLKPTNIIDEMVACEIADMMWRSRRYRRYSTALIKTAIPAALEQLLIPLMDDPSRFGSTVKYGIDGHRKSTPAMDCVNQWLKQDSESYQKGQ